MRLRPTAAALVGIALLLSACARQVRELKPEAMAPRTNQKGMVGLGRNGIDN